VDGTNNDDGGDDDDNVLLPASGRFRLTLFRSAPNTDDIDGNNDCPPIDMPVPMAVSGSGAGPVSVSMFMSMSSPLALPPLSLQRCDGIFLYGREIVHSESDATLATLEVLTMDQPDRNRAPHVLHRPAATIATTLWDATLVIEPDQPAETTQQQHTSHGCFVAMNRFRVRDRCKALFEARWANRRSKLSLQPGFVGFSLLRKRKHNHNGNGNGNGNDNDNHERPADAGDERCCRFNYSTCTIWDSRATWERWRNGEGRTSHEVNRQTGDLKQPKRVPLSEWLEGPSSPIFWEGSVAGGT